MDETDIASNDQWIKGCMFKEMVGVKEEQLRCPNSVYISGRGAYYCLPQFVPGCQPAP